MTNLAHLVATNTPGPAGLPERQGYDPATDLIAVAPLIVPVFWLSLFNRSHLSLFEEEDSEDEPLPTLVAEMAEATRLLGERRELLLDFFPEFQPALNRFTECLSARNARYARIDLEEIWETGSEGLTELLEESLRWFESRSEDKFSSLTIISNIYRYDREKRTFESLGSGTPRTYHLLGYGPWDNEAEGQAPTN